MVIQKNGGNIVKKGIQTLWKVLFVMCLCCSLAGCGEKQESLLDLTIGVVVYDGYDTFVSQLIDVFTEQASKQMKTEGRKIRLLKMDSAGSQIVQNDQVRELLKKGCDVLCVNLVDRTDPSMIIEYAREADVPVIFFNRELVNQDLYSWEKLYYVGADAYESGMLEGQIAAEEFHKNKNMDKNGDGDLQLVVLEGEPGHQDAIIRSENSVSTLMDSGIVVDKLESGIANWKRTEAQNKMSQMLDKFDGQIELVLANNDDMALGALDEFEARRIPKRDWPAVVGIDGTKEGLAAVENGWMIGTVYNDKDGQGKAMLALALAVADSSGKDETLSEEKKEELGLKDGKYIRFPYAMVTKENVQAYIER